MISFSEMMAFNGKSDQAVSSSSRVKLEPAALDVSRHVAPGAPIDSLIPPPGLQVGLTPRVGGMATTLFVPPKLTRKTSKGPSISASDSFDTTKILEDLRYFKNKQKIKENVVEKVIKPQSVVGMRELAKYNDEMGESGLGGNSVGSFIETSSQCITNNILVEHVNVSESQKQQEAFSITQLESFSVDDNNGHMGIELNTKIDEGNFKTIQETIGGSENKMDKDTILVQGQSTNVIKEGSFMCELCKRYFTSLKYLGNHLSKAHFKEQAFDCQSCNLKFKSAKTLKQHVAKVHNRPLFRCAFCEKTFKTEALLLKHQSFVHEQKLCQYCRRSFKNANALRSHRLRCRVNPKLSKNREVNIKKQPGDETKQEVSIHDDKSGDQPLRNPSLSLVCILCQKKFNHKSSLSRHKRQNHKADPSSNIDVSDYVILDAVSLDVIKDISVSHSFVIGDVGTECVQKVTPEGGGEREVTDTLPLTTGGGEGEVTDTLLLASMGEGVVRGTLLSACGREGEVTDTLPRAAGGGEGEVTGLLPQAGEETH